jgi:MoxR-like ATPase
MPWQPMHMAAFFGAGERGVLGLGRQGRGSAGQRQQQGKFAWVIVARMDERLEGSARTGAAATNRHPGSLMIIGAAYTGSTPATAPWHAPPTPMKFQGSDQYVATQDLMLAVNAAITLKRPLLVKGEPGTGKTMLAEEVATALDMPLLQWHIKSTTKAQQGLYEYDAVSRLRDSQLADDDSVEKVATSATTSCKGVLWQAFTAEQPVALLIDEIDKADIEFPNDLLRELDRMEFYVYETRELVKARHRPVVFITSNNEKELPDAFLRRCFFHYIKFPDADTMQKPSWTCTSRAEEGAAGAALKTFYDVRNLPGLKKKPSTSELLDWLKLLVAEDIPLKRCRARTRRWRAAAGGRAAEERAGRDAVREARLHAAPQPLSMAWRDASRSRCGRRTRGWCRCRTAHEAACATPRATASCGSSGTPRCPRPRA